MSALSPDEQLAEDLAGFYADPLGYVMYCFPWDTETSIQVVELAPVYRERFGCRYGPDVWACEFLDELGRDIRERNFDGRTPVLPIQKVTASGHGIGKSCLSAWLIKFILDTRPLSMGTVTAMKAEQLRTKTWAQLGKWHKMSLTSHWFDYTSGRGSMALVSNRLDARGESIGEKWRCDAQTCKKENAQAFAGQHCPTATSFFIFDEASEIENEIFEVRDGGLTDGEPMVFDFGNPTRNSGRFYEECEGRLRHRYDRRSIDSRTVQMSNKPLIEQWLEDFGEDNDWFKVRVRGMFPSMGSLQFISTDLVEEAMERDLKIVRGDPLVIGVDVARYGDDSTVIYPRIGHDARSFPREVYKGLSTMQVVGRVAAMVERFAVLAMPVNMIFVDVTGGLGAGPADRLRQLGYPVYDVEFGSNPTDVRTYRFKSDELWGRLRDALLRLCLPARNEPGGEDLRAQLTQREFGYTLKGSKIHLEPKREMKVRLGGDAASPDDADALACTYAVEVVPAAVRNLVTARPREAHHEYDPQETKW